MTTQTSDRSAVRGRLDAKRIAELRRAVKECYCGLGPACPLWRQFTPAQRAACSLDKRAVAQALWMNGM